MSYISKLDKTDLRLNLHSSPKEKHHDMIILQRKNYKCPVHKHLSNGETIHIIKGSMAILVFNKKKKLVRSISRIIKDELRVSRGLLHIQYISSGKKIFFVDFIIIHIFEQI